MITDDTWSERRKSFGGAAADYARGRPSYPPDAVAWALPEGARRVVDLGAGTGRLTERLLAAGLDIVAVEPLAEMRAHIPSAAEVLDGTAEAIPLPHASVDAVLVGHAFHWFDIPRAMAEIARVLRPGGTVGLLWNMLDDREPWVAALASAIAAEDRLSAMTAKIVPPYRDVAGLTDPEQRMFPNPEPYDVDRIEAFVRSRSQTILLSPADRDKQLQTVRELVPSREFALPLICEAWRGERAAGPG
jgi:SAM-dependent methyltransferase